MNSVRPLFSVLLPTRNGGEFIADCIHSILSQDFDRFELVVSDNANSDKTKEVLAGISDPRMRVVTQEKILAVDENWNAALSAARGDYFVMMGDDDYLMPGALRCLQELLSVHESPDCILFNGYSYVAPNSIREDGVSYWSPYHHHYDSSFSPGEINVAQRMSIVTDMFRFRQKIPLNMQTTVFSRRAVTDMKPVFLPPFPDHYLLNALLIDAGKWVFAPQRLVVVGVSPKSFGHYFYEQKSVAGLDYLGVQTREPGLLPGNELLNGMYRWLLLLLKSYPAALRGVRVNRPAYLIRQLRFWLVQYRYGTIERRELAGRLKSLSVSDWFYLFFSVFDSEVWRRIARSFNRRSSSQADALWSGLRRADGISGIRGFAEWLSREAPTVERLDPARWPLSRR